MSARATGSAGQLKNDGSTTFTRLSRPGRVEFDPVRDRPAPSLDQAEAATGPLRVDACSAVCLRRRAEPLRRGPRSRDAETSTSRTRTRKLASTSPPGSTTTEKRVAEVDERVVASGVDVDAGGAGHVAQGAELEWLRPRLRTAVPVKRSRTVELARVRWRQLGDLRGDGGHDVEVGERSRGGLRRW